MENIFFTGITKIFIKNIFMLYCTEYLIYVNIIILVLHTGIDGLENIMNI